MAALLPVPPPGAAEAAHRPSAIAVLYPDIPEPYRSVFTGIIQGVEDAAPARVVSIPVKADADPAQLAGDLRREDVRVVIALGRNGLKVANTLEGELDIVGGAVVSVPESEARSFPIHSLAPDPALLFARLRAFLPAARRVFVVYDPRQNDWLMRLSREAAKAHGLELAARQAADLKTASRHYAEILAEADPQRDAVWLPQDSIAASESGILPMILQESWNRNLIVFSSSLGHVRRGALFSLYPDNVEIGRALADSAKAYLSQKESTRRGVTPMKEVRLAINARTARHLGIDVEGERSRFDLIFAEQ